MAVPVALAQRQTTGEDWVVVVGRGDQEEAADDEQQQKVRLGMLEATSDDQRPVRWEAGWGLEATADDQRPVRWEGGGDLKQQLMTRGQSGGREGGGGWSWRRQLMTRGRGVSCGGEVRQLELESARREGEGEGAPQQQSTACQNGRRTRSVGLEALVRC